MTSDPLYSDPELARLYDALNGDRSDLDPYAGIADEVRAGSILDVGCGTGTFACRMANAGRSVIGVDPAEASLDIARRKPGAERVRWLRGLAGLVVEPADLAVMTGNVAMVFVDDVAWTSELAAVHGALKETGWFAFESRDPARRAWERWTRADTWRSLDVAGAGRVNAWTETLDVRLPLVTFRHSFEFPDRDLVRTSTTTLRFRALDEIRHDLDAARLELTDVRDAPDRPGLEFVCLARRR